jgi:hypothetical protein
MDRRRSSSNPTRPSTTAVLSSGQGIEAKLDRLLEERGIEAGEVSRRVNERV